VAAAPKLSIGAYFGLHEKPQKKMMMIIAAENDFLFINIFDKYILQILVLIVLLILQVM
jgi:hypothetical protein